MLTIGADRMGGLGLALAVALRADASFVGQWGLPDALSDTVILSAAARTLLQAVEHDATPPTRIVMMVAAALEHEVVVDVTGEIKPGGLERLNRVDHGFTFNGVLLSAAKVSFQSEARLRFALKGERPGQIAFMCESVGLQVAGMKRLRIGRVPLSDLPVGQWRYLTAHERF